MLFIFNLFNIKIFLCNDYLNNNLIIVCIISQTQFIQPHTFTHSTLPLNRGIPHFLYIPHIPHKHTPDKHHTHTHTRHLILRPTGNFYSHYFEISCMLPTINIITAILFVALTTIYYLR